MHKDALTRLSDLIWRKLRKTAFRGRGGQGTGPEGKLSQRRAINIRSEFERARARSAKHSPAILAEIGPNARKTGQALYEGWFSDAASQPAYCKHPDGIFAEISPINFSLLIGLFVPPKNL